MKVGVSAGTLPPSAGGGYVFSRSIVEALKRRSSSHSFIFIDEAEDQGNSEASVAKRKSKALRRLVGSHRVFGPAGRVVQRWVTGVVSSTPKVAPLERAVAAAGVDVVWFLVPGNAPLRTPYIATVWDLQHRLQPFFPEVSVTGWTWEQREHSYSLGLRRAARVIAGTEVGKQEILRFYGLPPENVHVIPLPAAPCAPIAEIDARASLRKKYGIRRPFLFYPAQFWPHKNHVNLLIALDLLARRYGLNVDLVLTGSDKGNRTHVENIVAKLNLGSRVHFLGFVARSEIEKLYREAVALVYPSFFGPDNLPPLEALALDCPVAAARVMGAYEQLGDAAALFNPTDPTAIADAIKPLISDHDLRERMIICGRKQVASRTPERYVAAMCDIIDEFESIRRCWGDNYVHF